MLSCNALRMGCPRNQTAASRGTTLVELTVATAIMATLFAALIPLFVGIRNSTSARWAGLEMVQNARVLNEQLCRYLTQARRIVAVSASTEDNGFVEFEAEDGVVYRCAVGTSRYIEFGPVESRRERGDPQRDISRWGTLAGPVEYLRFTCYSEADFDTPVQTPNDIRLVSWEAGFQSAGPLTQGKSVTGACCLRVSARVGDGGRGSEAKRQ
jgi:type II secretory pathway pseudopilin PulG